MDTITAKFKRVLAEETLPEARDEGKGYEMWNDGSVEVEVGEFFYGLTRLLKPNLVLETGSYKGVALSYIAEALKDNGYGKIDTLEYDFTHIKESRDRISRLALEGYVNFVQTDSLRFEPKIEPEQYDMILLDTEPNIRFQELVKYYKYLKPGGYLFIHDLPKAWCQGNINPDHPELPSWPYGDVPEEIKHWLNDRDLVKFSFPNPREMCGFQKRDPRDYQPWTE